ncbi:uncharacterized protein [Parasteatoda tepidariorum]|uniref:uncharacterized protein n=1 Tax=Parasteatoda tepidariorum TaxID=114398 RepID=UPI001C727F55|nr:uncharacterized protein LOC107453130 [Parasteatoda tepidariorum]
MWAFGCLAMELLSYFAITRAAPTDQRKEMYTTILNRLEENRLLWPIMTKIFSADDLRETDVKLALQFIKEFLKFDASHRLPASKALMHDFFHQDDDSIHDNVDAKHTSPTNSTAQHSEHLSVDEAAILENIDANQTKTLSERNRMQVNESQMSEIVINKSTDEQSMPGTEMITLMLNTLSVKGIKLEDECGMKPSDIEESDKEQSVTKTEDNTRIDMEKNIDLILLKMTELTDEVKYLRIKMENMEKRMENLIKINMNDETITKTGESGNIRNEIKGESIVHKPIDSVRINSDEVAIAHKEITVKKEKKTGRALKWMRTACRSAFSLFKKRRSN